MLIATDEAQQTLIHNNPNYQKVMEQTEYRFRCTCQKQAEMILATEKEVLIGGAAGGSKSTSLLIRALFYQSVNNIN